MSRVDLFFSFSLGLVWLTWTWLFDRVGQEQNRLIFRFFFSNIIQLHDTSTVVSSLTACVDLLARHNEAVKKRLRINQTARRFTGAVVNPTAFVRSPF